MAYDPLKDTIYLAALYAELPKGLFTYGIEEVTSYRITPAKFHTISILDALVRNKRVTLLSPNGDESSSVEPMSLSKHYILQLPTENNDEELGKLIHTAEICAKTCQRELKELEKQVLVSDAIAFIEEQVPDLQASHTRTTPALLHHLHEILDAFCFDELLLILWRACQDVSPRDLRIASAANDTEHLLNKILTSAERYFQHYKNNNKRPKKFRRYFRTKPSAIQDILIRISQQKEKQSKQITINQE